MEKQKLSKSRPKPTPQGLPTPKRLEELMKGVDRSEEPTPLACFQVI